MFHSINYRLQYCQIRKSFDVHAWSVLNVRWAWWVHTNKIMVQRNWYLNSIFNLPYVQVSTLFFPSCEVRRKRERERETFSLLKGCCYLLGINLWRRFAMSRENLLLGLQLFIHTASHLCACVCPACCTTYWWWIGLVDTRTTHPTQHRHSGKTKARSPYLLIMRA